MAAPYAGETFRQSPAPISLTGWQKGFPAFYCGLLGTWEGLGRHLTEQGILATSIAQRRQETTVAASELPQIAVAEILAQNICSLNVARSLEVAIRIASPFGGETNCK